MLFDSFEKQFDLPAGFVQFTDGLGRKAVQNFRGQPMSLRTEQQAIPILALCQVKLTGSALSWRFSTKRSALLMVVPFSCSVCLPGL